MGDDTKSLAAEQVVSFLAENADFFQQYPQALENIELNMSPEGSISLAQRQIENLRQKSRQLNEQLHALLENAHSNSALQNRVHNLCLILMDAKDVSSMLRHLVIELKQEFEAEFVAIRLFVNGENELTLPEIEENISQLHAVHNVLRDFDNLLSKQQPVCGRLTKKQKTLLFGEQEKQVQSVACVPLGHDPCAGILAIASTDPNRFHSDMGTVYLAFLGGVVVRLIRQYCHSGHGD